MMAHALCLEYPSKINSRIIIDQLKRKSYHVQTLATYDMMEIRVDAT
jgi:hypothetical protein